MKNGQRTNVISEDSHFHKISINTLTWTRIYWAKQQRSRKMTSGIPSQLASVQENQNKRLWRKDRQEDLLVLFNNTIDLEWILQLSQSRYSEWVHRVQVERSVWYYAWNKTIFCSTKQVSQRLIFYGDYHYFFKSLWIATCICFNVI